MKRKGFFLLLMMTITILLTSCWSKKELTDLAIVAALGVDKTKDGRYHITLQIINPGNVAGGMQGGGGGTQSPPITIYSASGDNVVEASRRASGRISRRLYYAHTNLVVVGEKLAKEEGINTLVDAFDRDPEFRNTSTLVIANHSSAADLVKTLTPVDKIPANKVLKTLEFTERKWGENVKTSLQEVMKSLESPGRGTVVSGFRLDGKPDSSVHTLVEVDIGDMEVPVDITNPKVITKIEQSVRKEIKKELKTAIERAQKNKTDILGFGEVVHRTRPNQFRKLKTEWNDVYFPKLDVDITVEAYVRRAGLRNKSFL